MMVLAQQEANQRKRDMSQIGAGEIRSQGFGQFMASFAFLKCFLHRYISAKL